MSVTKGQVVELDAERIADRSVVASADGVSAAAMGAAQPVGTKSTVADPGTAPDSLGKRFMRPQTLISFGLALFIVFFFFRQLDVDAGAVWSNIQDTNVLLYGLAFAAFYGAFILRALRWRMMLARVGIDRAHGYPVPGLPATIEIFLLSWFANCVVPAKLGDAYRGYLLKRTCGAPFSTSLGTILAERLTDLVVLVALMIVSAIVVFGGDLPGQATQTVAIGGGLLLVGLVGLIGLWFARSAIQRRVPARWQAQFARLHSGLFVCLRRPAPFVAFSLGIWALEGVRLWLVARALGAELSSSTALFVALMGSLLTTVPITPAGLGVVEVTTVKVLQLVDVETDLAGSIALLDRVVGYWSVIAVGLVLYMLRVRRELAADAVPAAIPSDAADR